MVLVVDDTPEICRVMVRLLRVDGYEADGVVSGAEAMEFLKAHHPHCVILDISMPDMDGFEVLTRIRADPAYASVRVVMYSAFDGELRTRAMKLGADAFIRKGSLDWARIQETLSQFCGPARSGGHRQAVPPARGRDVC